MEDYWLILVVILIGVTIITSFLSWIFDIRHKVKKYDGLKPKLDNLEYNKHQLSLREAEFNSNQFGWKKRIEKQQITWKEKTEKDKFEWEKKVESDKEAIEILAKEKSKGFPWLADAYAEYFYLQGQEEANYLNNKKHPAPVSANKVREIARKRRIIEKKLRIKELLIIIKTYFLF